MKEMEVTKVALDLELKTPVVLLKERKGTRISPIWIGLSEARVIALIMKGLPTPYSTFDLAKKLIEKFRLCPIISVKKLTVQFLVDRSPLLLSKSGS